MKKINESVEITEQDIEDVIEERGDMVICAVCYSFLVAVALAAAWVLF